MTASAGPRPLENRPVGGVGAWGGNLPGLADGLAPERIAPALVIAGASVYVAAATGVAMWARWRPTEAGT